MKYAQLGPMLGVLNVIDSDTPLEGMQELTHVQAARVGEIIASNHTPFFLEGDVTTLDDYAGAGFSVDFDEASGFWVRLPLPPETIAARNRNRVPQSLANWRVKAVLDIQGLTPTVDAAIASMEDGPDKIVITRAWHGNGEVLRNSPTVNSFMAILQLTEGQVDEMFKLGATFNP